jgi:tRNA U34 5-carboxymethylaminomethyl modifying GTPase MnmE/TrmE
VKTPASKFDNDQILAVSDFGEMSRRMEGSENEFSHRLALDLHLAVKAVGEIVGKTTTEDLLDSIFSQFCLGK